MGIWVCSCRQSGRYCRAAGNRSRKPGRPSGRRFDSSAFRKLYAAWFDPEPVPGSPIPCPRRFRVEAIHGDDWLRGSYRRIRIQEKKDVLSDYPYLFRQLARLITKETWSYRFWSDFDFELHQDGRTRKIRGIGTSNFIEPMPAD